MATVSLQWLAWTKLQAPARRRDALPRPRLVQAVEQGLESARLTLITAPAGSGKTTLLTELPFTLRDRQWAWLLLDREDNDATLFAAALVASLQKLDPRIGAGVWNAEDLAMPAWRRAATSIINDLARVVEQPTVVVLDDFHAITDRTVIEMVDYLVERVPEHVRFLIATRYRPELALARLRARGDLAEFTLDHLSFTASETSDLVQRSLGLSMTDAEIRLMCARTQGWAAGIRLLAASAAQSPGVREKLLDSSYTSRRIFDFLSEEVLEHQPPEIQQFLLETSILSSLQPEVCGALTGRADAQAILEDLYRRSLFVVAADDTESSFRYHDLFAQFLRSKLTAERPADLAELHRRAARAETSPQQRIRHLLAARDWDAAAEEILKAAPRYLELDFSATLRRWIEELPAEVQARYPRMQYALGRATWSQGEWSHAMPHLQRALEGFQASGDREGQGETMVALAVAAFAHNDIGRAGEMIAGALDLPIPPSSRVQLLTSRSWVRMLQQDWAGADADIAQTMTLLAAPEGFSQRNSMAVQLAMFQTGLAGGPERLEKLCRTLAGWLDLAKPSVNLAYYHVMRSALLLCRGEIHESDQACAESLRVSLECGGVAFCEMGGRVGASLASMAAGDWPQTIERASRTRDELMVSDMGRGWLGLPLYLLGRAQWLTGDVEGLRRTYNQIAEPSPQEMPAMRVFRPMLRAMLQIAARAPVQAESALLEAVEAEDAVRVTRALGSAQVLKAHFHRQRGQTLEALDAFKPFLLGCERAGAPGRVLLEGPLAPPLLRLAIERNLAPAFAERMLERLGEAPQPKEPPAGQLSERELDVLRLMGEGLGNRDIAGKLFVSEATVKTHVQRILRKLDATSRTQAVVKAREQMLLD